MHIAAVVAAVCLDRSANNTNNIPLAMQQTHFPFHSLPREVQLMIVYQIVSNATHVKDGLIPLLTLFDVDEMDVDVLLEFLILWRKKDEDDPFLIHTVHIISAGAPRVLNKIFTLWNSRCPALVSMFGLQEEQLKEPQVAAALESKDKRILDVTLRFVEMNNNVVNWNEILRYTAEASKHASLEAMLQRRPILNILSHETLDEALFYLCGRHMYYSFGDHVPGYEYLEAHERCVELLLNVGANPMVFLKHAHHNIKHQINMKHQKRQMS